MKDIFSYNTTSLSKELKLSGIDGYRAKQLFAGFFSGKDLNELYLDKKTKDYINENYTHNFITLEEKQVSKDKTQKYLFKLNDNNFIEAVLMKYKHGYSLCISTQVGCNMQCTFCASGINKLTRNLTVGEMVSQVVYINNLLGGGLGEKRKISSIVLMGIGEPLDNYKNVKNFIESVTDNDYLNFSRRSITLSTCGIIKKIKDLADDALGITLTVSLHSALDEIRKNLMPIAKLYTVNELLHACDYYYNKTNRRVTFEYILIEDITVSKKQGDQLVKLFKNRPHHINLINMNPIKESELKPVKAKEAIDFKSYLESRGLNVTLRRTLGKDIDGACGQLRKKHR